MCWILKSLFLGTISNSAEYTQNLHPPPSKKQDTQNATQGTQNATLSSFIFHKFYV